MHTIGHRSNPFYSALLCSALLCALFHCSTSFNVCLNFFIEWTILKFSACSGQRFFDNFPSDLFLLYFHYAHFCECLYINFSTQTEHCGKRKGEGKEKGKKTQDTHTHVRYAHIADHSILMTTNPFLTIYIVMVISYTLSVAWPFKTGFSCCVYQCWHTCTKRTHVNAYTFPYRLQLFCPWSE